MKSNKGFTLIELLVVIAIIGILSSVVLASLNSARDKGSDAAIKANLNGIRAQAELFYDGAGNGTYTGLLADSNVSKAIAAADSANGAGRAVYSHAGTSTWAVSGELKSVAAQFYCIDGKGNATTTATSTITDGDCN